MGQDRGEANKMADEVTMDDQPPGRPEGKEVGPPQHWRTIGHEVPQVCQPVISHIESLGIKVAIHRHFFPDPQPMNFLYKAIGSGPRMEFEL
jgi:hypothetical protein